MLLVLCGRRLYDETLTLGICGIKVIYQNKMERSIAMQFFFLALCILQLSVPNQSEDGKFNLILV